MTKWYTAHAALDYIFDHDTDEEEESQETDSEEDLEEDVPVAEDDTEYDLVGGKSLLFWRNKVSLLNTKMKYSVNNKRKLAVKPKVSEAYMP